jgi:hypothetical protein
MPSVRLALFSAVALAPLVVALPVSAQTATFILRHSPGEVLRYETKVTSESALPGMFQLAQSQRLVTRRDIVSVNEEGSARIRETVESLVLELDTPAGRERFDSTNPSASSATLAPMAARLADRVTESVMGTDGSLLDRATPTASVDAVLQGVGPEARGAIESMGLTGAISGLVVGGGAPELNPLFPAEPVALGEQWEVETTSAVGAVTRQVYTFEAIEELDGRRIALVRISGNSSAPAPAGGAGGMGGLGGLIGMGGGALSGHLRFDLDRGVLVEQVQETRTEITALGMAVQAVTRTEVRLIPGGE